MIIVCPSCKKKFEVNSNLIPNEGRLIKCGSCNHTWFFNQLDQIKVDEEIIIETPKKEVKKTQYELPKRKIEIKKDDISKLPDKMGTELIKYQPKFSFTFGKILNYLIVLIISFVAVIITLDTFKSPLSVFFPNIELILYSLFETMKDLILFIKDLK